MKMPPPPFNYMCALDGLTLTQALALVDRLKDVIPWWKAHDLADGCSYALDALKNAGAQNILLDAKVKDIPATTERRVRAMASTELVDAVTVHADELDTLRAATQGGLKIFGVTVLTSLDRSDYPKHHRGATVEEDVEVRVQNILKAGAYGSVCSGLDVGIVNRIDVDHQLIRLVPGTRLPGSAHHDQKSVTTPGMAYRAGASMFVLGRELVRAPDPFAVITAFNTNILEAHRGQS